METVSRDKAWEILTKYNKEPFHLQHAETVEGVMKWFADELGHGADRDYWGVVGLLHDIDFELYPEEHCRKAPELLRDGGVGEDVIRSVVSHGWGLCADVEPRHEMEKVLYATDELTGLIWAVALMRPSKSVMDLELKSVKKKFKTLAFAAGCNREVIKKGAEILGWELDDLISRTILAMRSVESKGPGAPADGAPAG
ncbi:MAG: hydrolase [Deltaproteobacteria bacterium]|jgi:predicted hydrolase (HD superfamily)|nr:hydrolase [Deltaproteobacteria bacterium]